jgi:hypothetical protein
MGEVSILKGYILHTRIRHSIKNNVLFFSIIYRIKVSFTQALEHKGFAKYITDF